MLHSEARWDNCSNIAISAKRLLDNVSKHIWLSSVSSGCDCGVSESILAPFTYCILCLKLEFIAHHFLLEFISLLFLFFPLFLFPQKILQAVFPKFKAFLHTYTLHTESHGLAVLGSHWTHSQHNYTPTKQKPIITISLFSVWGLGTSTKII